MLTLLSRTCITVALAWAAGPGAQLPAIDPTLQLPLERRALGLSDDDLEKQVIEDPNGLGSLSLGEPHRGRLLGGVPLQSSRLLEVVAPDVAFGTHETVAYLERAVRRVQELHDNTPPLSVGHISRPSGGYVSPHKSHQSGRDVDLGFYYAKNGGWYRRGTADNLDLARCWSLVRALITETDVEMIIVDNSIQRLLQAYAERIGEDRAWLKRIFSGDAEHPEIIRHLWGHTTHFHVRFFNPAAQTLAARAYPHLVDADLVDPVQSFTTYRAKKGDTLGRLANRFGTTVRAIQAANGMRGTVIQAKKVYRIPRAGGPTVPVPLTIPSRCLPPTAPPPGR